MRGLWKDNKNMANKRTEVYIMIGFIIKKIILTLAIGFVGLFDTVMFAIVLENDYDNK